MERLITAGRLRLFTISFFKGRYKLRQNNQVKVPLTDLKSGSYYGCTLRCLAEVGIEPFGQFELMNNMSTSLGAQVVGFTVADNCFSSLSGDNKIN